MNIFNAIKIYPGSWNESARRSFTEEEKTEVDNAYVVESDYGLSVCFVMRGGGKAFIPLDRSSKKAVGDSVNLDEAELVTLSRKGDADIQRVKC